MTQLDQILLDDSEPGLTPQQFLERWKPVLESLDRMYGDASELPGAVDDPKS